MTKLQISLTVAITLIVMSIPFLLYGTVAYVLVHFIRKVW